MDTPANLQIIINDLCRRFSDYTIHTLIIISINEQKLYLVRNNKIVESYIISSSKKGTGYLSGSYKTPLGAHYISEKIGAGAEPGSIFKARKNTHKLAKILPHVNERSNEDNITSRILWLTGLEDGINKGGNVDSHNRYIYIHGTDEEGQLGKPVSHGCIRMSNQDVINLFNHVTIGTLINIIN